MHINTKCFFNFLKERLLVIYYILYHILIMYSCSTEFNFLCGNLYLFLYLTVFSFFYIHKLFIKIQQIISKTGFDYKFLENGHMQVMLQIETS